MQGDIFWKLLGILKLVVINEFLSTQGQICILCLRVQIRKVKVKWSENINLGILHDNTSAN
jgi:hypothetical protein